MRVLIACEESQEVCKAFRAKGHEAFSCDILLCSGGHPEWHIHGNVLNLLIGREFKTQDKTIHEFKEWDLMIAHPPCTYLCNSGVSWLHKQEGRFSLMEHGSFFFRALLMADIPLIAIENPIMHKYAVEIIGRRQNQIIQPWQFGHGETKATCLWLKGLSKLEPTNIVEGREQRLHKLPPSKDRAKLRSKTYPGIAKAMAEQWG